jgi:uncharacterized membrane protein YqiK
LIESSKYENSVKLSEKRVHEINSSIEVKKAEAGEALAVEEVSSKRDKEIALREKVIAIIRAEEQAEVDTVRVSSETDTVTSVARAEAEASKIKSDAEKEFMLAKAEGQTALISAENLQSKDLINMKLHSQKLKVLPEVVEKLMKPTEKIEGIRINNITGFNKSNGVEGGRISQDSSVNKVVDSVLDLALQLPAVKKIGEEVGLNISDGLKGISAALEPDDQIKKDEKKSK